MRARRTPGVETVVTAIVALCLADAIDFMATLHPDGWPGLMAENRAKAVAGRRRLLQALGTKPLAPEAMLGAMAAVALPVSPSAVSDDAAEALRASLFAADRIEVPVQGWPVPGARRSTSDAPERVLLRISAQRYVEPEDIERLIAALGLQLAAAGGPGKGAAQDGEAVPARPAPLTVMQGGRRKAYRPLAAEERDAAFRAGLDAYRAGEPFEAHELWEPAWMGTADPAERDFLQGLIKVAAAHVHRGRGNAAGMATNLRGARARLASALAHAADARDLDLAGIVAAVDEQLDRLAELGVGGDVREVPPIGL